MNRWGRATPQSRVDSLDLGEYRVSQRAPERVPESPQRASPERAHQDPFQGPQKETYAAYRTLSSQNHNI